MLRLGKMRFLGTRLTTLAFLAVLSARALGSQDPLALEGSLRLYAHPADTNREPFISSRFAVTMSNCWWAVNVHDFEYHHPRGGGPEKISYAGDCESYYELTHWGETATAKKREYLEKHHPDLLRQFAGQPLDREVARAYSEPYPRNLLPSELAPWLAVASAGFLESHPSNAVPGVIGRMRWPTNRLVSEWQLIESGQASFPNEIRFYFQDGDLGFLHRVTEWQEGTVPKRFEQIYYQNRLNQDDDLVPSVIILGEASRTENGVNVSLPAPSQTATIFDRRTNIGRPTLVYSGDQAGGWLDPSAPDFDLTLERIRNDKGISVERGDSSNVRKDTPLGK